MLTGRASGYALLAAAIALNAAGQILLKRASLGRAAGAGGGFVRDVLLSPWLVAGAAAHVVTMLVWLLVLRRLPLTIAYPLTGSVFIIVPLASNVLWSEPLGPQRMIGIAVIAIGIAVVASAAS